MMEGKKKYTIRESELKDLIRKCLLYEVYNGDDYGGYTSHWDGKRVTPYDLLKTSWDAISNMPAALKNGIESGEMANFFKDLFNFNQNTNSNSSSSYDSSSSYPIVPTGPIKPGKNADHHETFNVRNAVECMRKNTNNFNAIGINRGKRMCGAYVGKYLHAGGLSIQFNGKTGTFGQQLLANGWREIPTNQAGQAGDVVIIELGGKTNRIHGHAAMCFGNDLWGTDYIHPNGKDTSRPGKHNLWGMQEWGPEEPGRIHTYRYKGPIVF